jgi:glycosyltransferase 2 family protein
LGPPHIEHSRKPLIRARKFVRDVAAFVWTLRRRMPRWAPQVLGYALSAGCLLWVLHNYPIRELIPQIRGLDWKWVFLGVALDLSVYVCHGWRWTLLLRPVARLRLWRTVQAVYIGLFANEVLPLRTGELIRGYLLAHWNDLLISVVFASEAVERLIDGLIMVAAFLLTAHFVRGMPGALTDVVRLMGLLLALGVALLAFVVLHKTHVHAIVRESRWAAMLRHVVEGLHIMGGRATLGRVVPVSLLYMVLQALSYWLLMKAFQLDLSVWMAAGVLAIVRFGTIIPSAPGNVGLFQWACVVAMHDVFGVEVNDSKTFSFVLFFALTLPLLIGGALATALTGLNLGEIHHHARRKARQMEVQPKPE